MIETLTDLPSELLYKVLSYLEINDILQALACCSDLYVQFATDSRLWSFLCFRDYGVKPAYFKYSMKFYQNLLFPYRNLIDRTFRCGSIIVKTRKTANGLLGFHHVWAPSEEKMTLFEISMNSQGTVNSSCCLNSGYLDEISESTFRWEVDHSDSQHSCSVEVYLSGVSPDRTISASSFKKYFVLRFKCDKGLVCRFKVMGVKGAFSGNTHSF